MLSAICDQYEKVILIVNSGGVVDLSFLDTMPRFRQYWRYHSRGRRVVLLLRMLSAVLYHQVESLRIRGLFL